MELSNLGLVSELVLELSEAGAQTDVRWSLTDESRRQHLREARQEAVHEARATADDYAAALGERVLNVTQITDQREMSISRPELTPARCWSPDAVQADATSRGSIGGSRLNDG